MEEQPRSLSEPVRETPLAHQCVCLLIHQTPSGDLRDKCYAVVGDPDSPFCLSCEEAGHPDAHAQAAERVVRRP